jgi:hypothetical protein
MKEPRPSILCLIGPIRFADTFAWLYEQESLKGKIVLYPILTPNTRLSPDQLVVCERLHLQKILISDEILVVNVGGYQGEGTKNEVAYALSHGKQVRYLEL